MYKNHYSILNFASFLKKRLIRIEPPYIASIILVLILGAVSAVIPVYRGRPYFIVWWNVAGHFAYLKIFNGAHLLCEIH